MLSLAALSRRRGFEGDRGMLRSTTIEIKGMRLRLSKVRRAFLRAWRGRKVVGEVWETS